MNNTAEAFFFSLFLFVVFMTTGTLSFLKAYANLRSNEKWLSYGIVAGVAFGLTVFLATALIVG